MSSRWRSFVESILPWFDPHDKRVRDIRSEAVRRRSIASRLRAERVIADYERAHDAASQILMDEVRRDGR